MLHAGNASSIVDGAAATHIASKAAREEYGWDPIARIVDSQVVDVDPLTMLTGPIPAAKEHLEQNDMTVDDIDCFEVNEVLASVIGAWLKECDGRYGLSTMCIGFGQGIATIVARVYTSEDRS